MEVIFNGDPMPDDQANPGLYNRAFAYGDGIFETMIVRRGSCTLLPYHFRRLQKSADILQIELPFQEKELESYIWQLASKSRQPVLRMRLQLWRREGGLYTPERTESDFLMTASPFEHPVWTKQTVGFARNVKLSPSAWSALKTMSALPYVLAGLEKKERQLDELIITDAAGHVAECTSANLFWYRNGKWYTPSLESGCIAGVMRAYLLDQMQQKEIPVEEILLPHEELAEAEFLLACNVTGIYSIRQLESQTFKNGRDRLTSLIQLPVL